MLDKLRINITKEDYADTLLTPTNHITFDE